jgi:hypothetical protein
MSRNDDNDNKWTVASVIFFTLACLVLFALTWYLLGIPDSHFDVLKKRLSVIGGWLTAIVAYVGAEKLLKVKGAPSLVFASWPVRVIIVLGAILSFLLLLPIHSIEVDSNPKRATIHIVGDKGDKGKTPNIVSGLYARMYDLTIEAEGFKKTTRTVSLTEVLKHRKITVDLEPEMGFLAVSSTPEGADIYLNEETQSRGSTPRVLEGLPAGFLTVVLKKEHYDDSVSRKVRIKPEQETILHVAMTRDEQLRHKLDIYSYPTGAEVYVDNDLHGTTNTTISLYSGTYNILLKKDGDQKQYSVEIPEQEQISWIIGQE